MQCNMKKIDLALWICRIPYDTTGWMSGLDRIVLIFNKIHVKLRTQCCTLELKGPWTPLPLIFGGFYISCCLRHFSKSLVTVWRLLHWT